MGWYYINHHHFETDDKEMTTKYEECNVRQILLFFSQVRL